MRAIFILIVILAAGGWIANLYKLSQLDFESPYKAEALRSAGVFILPAGAILGYIDIND